MVPVTVLDEVFVGVTLSELDTGVGGGPEVLTGTPLAGVVLTGTEADELAVVVVTGEETGVVPEEAVTGERGSVAVKTHKP